MISSNQQNFTTNLSQSYWHLQYWSMDSGLVSEGIAMESEDSLFKPY